jgi:diaminopimelate epimerase
VRFEKWQALGNDYVIVERDNLPCELTAERIQRLCEPHFGIGSDGILLLGPAEDSRHEAELRIFNPDGSEAELSGNGAREAALYLAEKRGLESFTMITKAGEVSPTVTAPGTVAMDIGRASVESADFPSGAGDGRGTLEAGGFEWSFQHVHIGNPQCAIEVREGLEELNLPAIGPDIENSSLFPNRTNVSFWRVDGSNVRARIFERGVGETLSSGTGASGAAVAAHLAGAPPSLSVSLDGGELQVDISGELDVRLTGTAQRVYEGELADDFMEG